MKHSIACVGCGCCHQECRLQANAISLTQDGVSIDLERCNRCGHCAAVCPTGAMNHPFSPLQEEIGAPLSPAQALAFLRAPRSVRQYRSEPVPKELLCQLLDAGRYPQTAKNTQGVHYLVVRDRDKMEQIRQLYREIVRALPADYPKHQVLLRPLLAEEERGFDALFYDCPQLLFATCDQTNDAGRKNAQFSLTFVSLMAPSLGLGTCWSGQLERLATEERFMPRFGALIGLPDGERICGCMMVGYPAVAFRRLVARDPLQVRWCEE